MNSDYIVIERELLKHIIEENKKLKQKLEQYEVPKKDEPMEKQISLEEYIKTLRKAKSNESNK